MLKSQLETLRVRDHSPELEHLELPPVVSNPCLDKKDRAFRRANLDEQRQEQKERREAQRQEGSDDDIKSTLQIRRPHRTRTCCEGQYGNAIELEHTRSGNGALEEIR